MDRAPGSQLLGAIEAGSLADSSRFELIDGEVVPLSPPFIPHDWIKADLGFALRMRVDRALSIVQEVSLQLSDTTRVEPDIVLCRLHGLPRRYLPASEVELVIEIADASARTDRLVKPGLYAQASIPDLGWSI